MFQLSLSAAVLFIVIQCIKVNGDECPTGWVRVLNKCYYNLHILVTREENRKLCSQLNANMLSIENEFEHSMVSAMTTHDFGYWLGAVRMTTESDFKWDTNETIGLTKWAEGEPSAISDAKSCVSLKNGIWRVSSCENRQNIFCQLNIEQQTLSKYPQCDYGWMRFENKCFLIEKVETKLFENELSCRGKGATLVTIHSRLENEFLNAITERSKYYWLGGFRVKHGEDVFTWFDNTRFDYKKWATTQQPPVFSNQPESAENNTCIYDGYWHDCGYDWDNYYHLCQKVIQPSADELNQKIDTLTSRLDDLKETVLKLGTLVTALYKQIGSK